MYYFTVLLCICLNYLGCGTSEYQKPDRRIVGGTWANISEFPYQVSLQSRGGHICGGSIIRSSYILTAAHCVKSESPSSLLVRAGSDSTDRGGITRKVCRIVINEKYDPDVYDYDIALLKLCEGLIYGLTIQPISLPTSKNILTSSSIGFVTGYGVMSEGSQSSTDLREITVRIVPLGVCRNLYKKKGPITNRMVCAGCNVGLCDSCQGDSGGPLVVSRQLVGVASWGYGCARPNYPGIYTKVSQMRKWIQSIVKL